MTTTASSNPTTAGSSKGATALRFLRDEGVFITQIMFSTAAMAFSIGMLVRGEDPAMYLPVLTATLGYWTPNPRTHYGRQAAFDSAMASALQRATEQHVSVEAQLASVQDVEDDIPIRIPAAFRTTPAAGGETRISVGLPIRAARTI